MRESRGSRHFVACSCGGVNHAFCLHYWPAQKDEEPSLYLEVNTPHKVGFWERLWSFLKGNDCCYLGSEVIYTPEEAKKHIEVLQTYVDAYEKHAKDHNWPGWV